MLQERRLKSNKPMLIAVAAIVILAGLAGYFFWKYQQARDPNAEAEATSKRVISELAKHYLLPSDEKPTVAQIKDKDKLKDQAFFSKAENGDYILVYPSSKIAIIYREKTDMIINSGPVSTDSKPAVGVLNGSGDSSKLSKALEKLKAVASVSVNSTTADAKSKNQSQTIVFDASKNNSAAAESIAKALGGQVQTSLPSGESAPAGADIVVIVGKNQQ